MQFGYGNQSPNIFLEVISVETLSKAVFWNNFILPLKWQTPPCSLFFQTPPLKMAPSLSNV